MKEAVYDDAMLEKDSEFAEFVRETGEARVFPSAELSEEVRERIERL